MAKPKNNLQEFLKEQQAREAKIKAREAGNTSNEAPVPQDTPSLDPEAIQANLKEKEIEELKNQLAREKKANELLRAKEDAEKNQKDEKAVNDVIGGFEKRYFEKDYSIARFDTNTGKELEPIKFHVKIRAANVLDYGQIEQTLIDLTDGRAKYMGEEASSILNALATLQVLGEDVPDWLVSGQGYNVDLLGQVYADYKVWLETFRTLRE